MDHKCERCTNKLCASKVSIFANLNYEELVEIIKMTGHKTFAKGDTIFLEGKKAVTLYLINQGKIKLYKYTKDGKEQILHILHDGEFFGELNLFKEGEYGFNAKALETTKLCTLSKDNMKELVLERPEIGLKILEVIGDRLSKVEDLAKNLASNDVEARIAHLLLDLKDEYGKKTNIGIEINTPITKGDMSNYIGVARETISRKLKKFQEENIIKLIGNKKIVIIDEEKLIDYCI